jgi:uncharacterized membrane protein
MNAIQIIKSYLITFSIFFLIDLFWIGVIAKKLYQNQIGFLLKENFSIIPAIIFYLLFIAAILFFVINPALIKNSWQFVLFAGAFLGLVAYATYDLTNLSTIKDWPILLTIIDIAWGTILTAGTAIISYLLIHRVIY